MKVKAYPKHEERSQNSRLYFDHENEFVWDNLMSRWDRPHREYRKLIPQVFEQLGIDPNKHKVKWSQYAGCFMCPCSPGFIIEGLHNGQNYNVTLEEGDLA